MIDHQYRALTAKAVCYGRSIQPSITGTFCNIPPTNVKKPQKYYQKRHNLPMIFSKFSQRVSDSSLWVRRFEGALLVAILKISKLRQTDTSIVPRYSFVLCENHWTNQNHFCTGVYMRELAIQRRYSNTGARSGFRDIIAQSWRKC